MDRHHNISTFLNAKFAFLAVISFCSFACAPRPTSGPDQTAGGAVAGASIGAGAGMVIGNQISHIGPGAAVGAGFGLLAGVMTGGGNDRLEETQVDMKNDLAALRAQTAFNRQQIENIQADYDQSATTEIPLEPYLVFFDDNATNLKTGAISDLEHIAENLKTSRAALKIEVAGNADESGSAEYNMKLSEARARNAASYLQARGISIDRVEVKGYGSTRPIATNSTPEGRQLNRRVEIRVLK
jgi:outer membrane protein OmpA-like peptidoglycan-associated protein